MKQIRANCPTCGRAFPKLRAVQPVDLSGLTDDQRYAYFHKIAPVEDVRFMLRVGDPVLSDTLRAAWEALLTDAPKLTRSNVYRRLHALQDRWRIERNVYNRMNGIPAVNGGAEAYWDFAVAELEATA